MAFETEGNGTVETDGTIVSVSYHLNSISRGGRRDLTGYLQGDPSAIQVLNSYSRPVMLRSATRQPVRLHLGNGGFDRIDVVGIAHGD